MFSVLWMQHTLYAISVFDMVYKTLKVFILI